MEERIKKIYNECWLVYKKYLATRNLAMFNQEMAYLTDKFENEADVTGLAVWFGARVQGLHDAYVSMVIKKE